MFSFTYQSFLFIHKKKPVSPSFYNNIINIKTRKCGMVNPPPFIFWNGERKSSESKKNGSFVTVIAKKYKYTRFLWKFAFFFFRRIFQNLEKMMIFPWACWTIKLPRLGTWFCCVLMWEVWRDTLRPSTILNSVVYDLIILLPNWKTSFFLKNTKMIKRKIWEYSKTAQVYTGFLLFFYEWYLKRVFG